MDTVPNQNTEEYDALEGVEQIDESVLNTPAKENKLQLPEIDDGQKLDTFMKFNKTPEVKTEEGIVLDLAGEQRKIDEGEISKETSSKLLKTVTGEDLEAEPLASPNAFLIIFVVSAALFGFLLMNFRQTEEMTKLKEEINRLKGKTNNLF